LFEKVRSVVTWFDTSRSSDRLPILLSNFLRMALVNWFLL
jgi:hypothetical protein